MQTQKELVRLHPRHGLLNIDVLSFKRLAYRVFEDLGVQLPAVLDDMGKSMVIRKVAGKLKKDLNLYGGHLEQPGFISQLKSQISELSQYGVSVEDLEMVEEETDRTAMVRTETIRADAASTTETVRIITVIRDRITVRTVETETAVSMATETDRTEITRADVVLTTTETV